MRDRRQRRAGFTLIEMLVVVGLMLVLTGLVLTVNLRTADQRKVIRAADQLQGWLAIAKQRAIRDHAIRGITIDPTGTQLQYVEQPEPWTPALLNAVDPTNASLDPFGAAIRVPTWDRDLVDATIPAGDARSRPIRPTLSGPGAPYFANWRNFVFLSAGGLVVNSGDSLEILEPPSVHQILTVFGPHPAPAQAVPPPSGAFLWYNQSGSPPPLTFPPSSAPYPAAGSVIPGVANLTWMLELGTPVPGSIPPAAVTPGWQTSTSTWTFPLWTTTNFRITRRPVPLAGEALLQMPKDTAILAGAPVGATATSGSSFSGTSLPLPATILFGPDGRLVGSTGNVVLWVYDTANVAEPTLIVIYSRTGLIANHPVNPSGNPYSFTMDGQPSGL